jgi:uncharacterized protein (UPF0147 family)
VFLLADTERTDELRRLVREGLIAGRALDTLAAACATRRNLDLLFEIIVDDQVCDAVRDGVVESVFKATEIMLRQLADDMSVDRAVRAAAAWAIRGADSTGDVAPLLTTPDLSPGTKFAAALFILGRDPSQLVGISERRDLPVNIRALAVKVLDWAGRDEELEQIAASEDADPEIRSLVLIGLFARDPFGVVMRTRSIPAESPIHESVSLMRETFTRELQAIVRDVTLDDGRRLTAMSLLAEAGLSAAYRDLIKDAGADDVIAGVPVSLAAENGWWPLLVEIIHDGDIPEPLRLAGVGLLHKHQRTGELAEIADAPELPDRLRRLARHYQSSKPSVV